MDAHGRARRRAFLTGLAAGAVGAAVLLGGALVARQAYRAGTGAPLTVPSADAVLRGSVPSAGTWRATVADQLEGSSSYLDSRRRDRRPAVVLDIDNTALQSYYARDAATPAVLRFAQDAHRYGYAVLFATGRLSSDRAGTTDVLRRAGYPVDGLCMRSDRAQDLETFKASCRRAWLQQGRTVVATVGNRASDFGGLTGHRYFLPDYGVLS